MLALIIQVSIVDLVCLIIAPDISITGAWWWYCIGSSAQKQEPQARVAYHVDWHPHWRLYVPRLLISLILRTKLGSIIPLYSLILFLIVEIAIYVSLAADFFHNYSRRRIVRPNAVGKDLSMRERGDYSNSSSAHASDTDVANGRGQMTRALRSMSYALVFSTLMLLGRALYRTVAVSALVILLLEAVV